MLAAGAGASLAAEATGAAAIDALWCAGFVAALAWVGGHAPRTPLLLAGAGTVLLAGSATSLAFALAAVAVGFVNALQFSSRRRLATLAAALTGLGLLTGAGTGDAWADAASSGIVAISVIVVGMTGMRSRTRRMALRWFLGSSLVAVAITALAGLAVLNARGDVDRGVDAFRRGADAVRSGDLPAAEREFALADDALDAAQAALGTFGAPLRLMPVLAQQARAVDTAVDTARDAAAVARRTVGAVDLDQLSLQGGTVDLAALGRLRGPADELTATLSRTVGRLEAMDRSYLVGPVSDALDDAVADAGDALTSASRVRRGLDVAPDLLGAQGPRRYLVLFTTPVESRNRYGFPGAYAVLRFEGGRLDYEDAGPIGDLNRPGGFDQAAIAVPPGARPYLGYGVTLDWRSVTVPLRFGDVAELARQLASQSPVGPVDGVLAASPEALAAVVGIVGDVRLDAVDSVLTAANTVDFLTRRQYLEFPELGRQRDRKDLLADMADIVGRRLESLDLPELTTLIDTVSPLLASDQLAVWVPPQHDLAAAELLAETGADASLPPATDVLHVGQLNGAGNKIDLFLQRRMRYDVTIEADGAVSAQLEMELTNQAPASGLPPYLGGSALDPPLPESTNRAILLVYGALPSAEVSLDGRRVAAASLYDRGLFVRQVAVDLGPGERRTLRVRQRGGMGDVPYDLLILPNGLPNPDEVTVRLEDRRDGSRATRSGPVRQPTLWPR